MPHITPLLPRHDIYLRTFDDSLNTCRFAHQFRQAWREIPLKARRRILNHWRSYLKVCALLALNGRFTEHQKELLADSIFIAALKDPDLFTYTNDLTGEEKVAACRCDRGGWNILFWVPAVEQMSDDALRVIVLRQMAKVYAWAMGVDPSDSPSWQWEVLMHDWPIDCSPSDQWAIVSSPFDKQAKNRFRRHGRIRMPSG